MTTFCACVMIQNITYMYTFINHEQTYIHAYMHTCIHHTYTQTLQQAKRSSVHTILGSIGKIAPFQHAAPAKIEPPETPLSTPSIPVAEPHRSSDNKMDASNHSADVRSSHGNAHDGGKSAGIVVVVVVVIGILCESCEL